MATAEIRSIVGIDLGTTHTALSWARPEAGAAPQPFAIPQWLAGQRWGALPLLPSVLYAPPAGELAGQDPDWMVGEYARIRAQETAGRAVISPKSWLCHTAVDRLGPILPWAQGEPSMVHKLSPVEASERILAHVRGAFEAAGFELAGPHVSVILTVPASFDPSARKLTVLAAERAGLNVRLLEEPLAAFYAYLGAQTTELQALAERGGGRLRVLVCDIGGGTTDLSLIDVELTPSGVSCRRSAVGRHLLLGGDNMDLAVAGLAARRLAPVTLPPERQGQLLIAARSAKEALLGASAPATFPIRLLGQGSQLFEQVISLDLERSAVEQLIVEGFFPRTARGQGPEQRRSGLTTAGLPYERDPAITRQLWEFIERHAGGEPPGALLLNGGVASSPAIVQRLLECLRDWGGRDVTLLSGSDLQLAVCQGAVRYGLSLCGFGPRVEGGASRGYYVAIDAAAASPRRALCVVPRGAKEGERHVAGARRFELLVGRRARFDLYSSDTALHAPGAVVELDSHYQPLPPLTAEIGGGTGATSVEVQLDGELSAVGTLDLGCTVVGGEMARAAGTLPSGRAEARAEPRFSLEFEIAAASALASAQRESEKPNAARLAAAEEVLERVFGKGRKDVTPREVKYLWRNLEHKLGARKEWDLEQSRRLVDVLISCQKARLRSEDHERSFWMLSGFCLRPGFGHAGDADRIARLWPSFEAGLTHRTSERAWQQFWIAGRRIAGGLGTDAQQRMRELTDPFSAPPELKLKKPKSFQPLAHDDMFDFASHLERLEPEARAELGAWFLERTWSDRDPRWWARLGRVGARVPAYADARFVVAPAVVERWLEQLLRERWDQVNSAAESAFRMARLSGDARRDISPALRARVAEALLRAGADARFSQAVRELVPLSESERATELGDDLPLGLRLLE